MMLLYFLIPFIFCGVGTVRAENFLYQEGLVGYINVPVSDLIAPDVRFTLEEQSVVQAAALFVPELFGQRLAYRRTQLLYGEQVVIFEENSGWYRVRIPGQLVIDYEGSRGCHGWVYAQHVIIAGKTAPTNLIVTKRQAPVLMQPSPNSTILFQSSCSTKFTAIVYDAAWCKISLLDGGHGFINASDCASLKKVQALSNDQVRNSIVNCARQFIDIPYVWGGRNSSGIDCSALVQLAYLSCGITIPRYAHGQWKACLSVEPKDLKPGDLIFLGTLRDDQLAIVHVMLYLGNNMLIEASGVHGRVRQMSVSEKLGKQLHELNNGDAVPLRRFIFAGRIIE